MEHYHVIRICVTLVNYGNSLDLKLNLRNVNLLEAIYKPFIMILHTKMPYHDGAK